MISQEYFDMLRTLEVPQLVAIEQLLKRQQRQTFCGISAEIMISDFVAINAMKKTDPENAEQREQKLFAICLGKNNEIP